MNDENKLRGIGEWQQQTEDLRALRDEMAKDVAAAQRSVIGAQPHIAPTVGRVVWYWPGGDDFDPTNLDRMFHCVTPQPMRADICFVHDDGTVTLHVNDHLGDSFQRPNITLHQGDAAGCSLPRPFATWMPYQKGQAAKTEAAEQRAVGSFQTEHERLNLAMLTEQVRQLRLMNDAQELCNEQQRAGMRDLGEPGKPVDQLPEVPGMPPHQVRMLFERDELSVKLGKLRAFIAGDTFSALEEHEQELIEEQEECMDRYLRALQDRIALSNEQQDQA